MGLRPVILSLGVVHLALSCCASPDLSSCQSWVPAASCNYTASSRPSSYSISYMIIHKAEGTAAGSASWMQNCASGVSAHYNVDNNTGYCYQSLREANVGWHAANWSTNCHSIGIEHGGYTARNDTQIACYSASSLITKHAVSYYGTPCDRNHIIGHNQVPGATHTDPGLYWNWSYYMSLCSPPPPPPQLVWGPQPSLVMRPDGGHYIFFIGTPAGDIWYAYKSSVGASCQFAQIPGGYNFSKVKAFYIPGQNVLYAFGIGDGSKVWINYQTQSGGPWAGWGNLGGDGFQDFDAVLAPNGEFALAGATVGGVPSYNCWRNDLGRWTGWTNFAGFGGFNSVEIAARADSTLSMVSWRNNGGTVWQFEQSAVHGGLTGVLRSSGNTYQLEQILNSSGQPTYFGTNGNGQIYTCYQPSPGSGWTSWALIPDSNISGRLDAFVNPGTGLISLYCLQNGTGHIFWWTETSPRVWPSWSTTTGECGSLAVDACQGGADFGKHVFWDREAFTSTIWYRYTTSAGGPWGSWYNMGAAFK